MTNTFLVGKYISGKQKQLFNFWINIIDSIIQHITPYLDELGIL